MQIRYYFTDDIANCPGQVCRAVSVFTDESTVKVGDQILEIGQNVATFYSNINGQVLSGPEVDELDLHLGELAHQFVAVKAAEQATILMQVRLRQA